MEYTLAQDYPRVYQCKMAEMLKLKGWKIREAIPMSFC